MVALAGGDHVSDPGGIRHNSGRHRSIRLLAQRVDDPAPRPQHVDSAGRAACNRGFHHHPATQTQAITTQTSHKLNRTGLTGIRPVR